MSMFPGAKLESEDERMLMNIFLNGKDLPRLPRKRGSVDHSALDFQDDVNRKLKTQPKAKALRRMPGDPHA